MGTSAPKVKKRQSQSCAAKDTPAVIQSEIQRPGGERSSIVKVIADFSVF